MNIEIVQDVTLEPVSLATIKNFCRIDADYSGEDETLTMLSKAAREAIEKATFLSLAPKVIRVTTCNNLVQLPYGIHGDIIKVTHSGEDVTPDDYHVEGKDFKTVLIGANDFGFFYPINGSFPIIEPIGTTYFGGDFTIEFNAGYSHDNIPQGLRHLILRLTDYYYANRGQAVGIIPRDIKGEVASFSRQIIL